MALTSSATLPAIDTAVERAWSADGDQPVPKCRLCYLVGELHTGGLERQLYYLLKEMDRERYQPAVAVWNYRADDVHVAPIRALDVPIYGFPTEWSSSIKLKAFVMPTSHTTVMMNDTNGGNCTEPNRGIDNASMRPPIA